MSLLQSIDIYLKAPYSQEVIAEILQRGKDIGFEYFHNDILDWDYSKLYDVATAAHILFARESASSTMPLTVIIKYEDTGFTLYTYKSVEGYLELGISLFISKWKKESMIIGQDFDFVRYIKLWRQVVPHYPWLAVETEQE